MRINKLKFIFLQSWLMIKNNKTTYSSLFFANMIGLILPLLILGLSTIVFGTYTEGIIDIENIAQVTLKTEEYEYNWKQLKNKINNLEYYSNISSFRTDIYSDHGFFTGTVQMVGKHYPNFFSTKFDQGIFFSDEQFLNAEPVCIITKDLANKLFENTTILGEKIYLEGLQFKIIGIIKEYGLIKNRIIIPDNIIIRHNERRLEETKYVLRFTSGFNQNQIVTQIKHFLDEDNLNYSFFWLSDLYRNALNETSKIIFQMIAISFLLTIFVFINLNNVVYALFDIEKKIVGIKYALGVSKRDLFIEKIISFLIISLASLMFISINLFIIINFIEKEIVIKIIKRWYVLLMPIISIIIMIALIEAFFLMRRLFKISAANILKD